MGCGAKLQDDDPAAPGYTPKRENEYCQRCFRMIHYDRPQPVSAAPMTDLSRLETVAGQFLWVIDVMDLEASLHSGFAAFFRQRRCSVVLNKGDRLPPGVRKDRLVRYVQQRVNGLGIRPDHVLLRDSRRGFVSRLEKILDPRREALVFCGLANVGKSTIINSLLDKPVLTVNRHPSTTLALHEVTSEKYGTIYDTVGLVDPGSVQCYLAGRDLKAVVNDLRLKETVFQLSGDQTILVGGLVKFDLEGCGTVTAVVYMSHLLPIRRANHARAEQYWRQHVGVDLWPCLSTTGSDEDMVCHEFAGRSVRMDYCVDGLGWISVTPGAKTLRLYADKNITVSERKAMIGC